MLVSTQESDIVAAAADKGAVDGIYTGARHQADEQGVFHDCQLAVDSRLDDPFIAMWLSDRRAASCSELS